MGNTESFPKVAIDQPNTIPYQYKPIHGRSIRLLKLSPIDPAIVKATREAAEFDPHDPSSSHVNNIDRLKACAENLPPNYEVELVHVSLDHGPDYEPISYTWGHASRHHSLHLKDGSFLPITETLKICIPYLINSSKTAHLWIDQLCINQEDNEEKGRQVTMMGDVYRKGQQTLVWLGMEDDASFDIIEEMEIKGCLQPEGQRSEFWRSLSSKDSLRYVDTLPRKFPVQCSKHEETEPLAVKRKIDLFPYVRMGREAPLEETRVLVCGPCLKAHTEKLKTAMIKFFSRPWFLRAWVVQEAVLSPWNVFMVGSRTLTTQDLEAIPGLLNDLNDLEGWSSITNGPERNGASRGYRSLHQMINMRQNAPGTKESEYTHVWQLLSHFRWTGIQATNPRDYIYAILGIHGRAAELFTPDYNLSVRDLYVKVTRTLIDASRGSLSILALCGNGVPYSTPGLPSWVPDWTEKPAVKTLEISEHVVAARHWPLENPKYASAPFSGILSVRGKRLGVVRWISDFNTEANFGHISHEEARCQSRSRHMLKLLDDLAQELNLHRPESAPKLRKGLMLWYLKLGVGSKPTVRRDGAEDICWTYGGSEAGGSLHYIATTSYGRRFCTGDGDVLGLIPKASVAGDEVWLLHGSFWQYVLRPVERGRYVLLGTGIWDWRRGPDYSNHCGNGWAEYKASEIQSIELV